MKQHRRLTVSRTPRSGEPGPIVVANKIRHDSTLRWTPALHPLARVFARGAIVSWLLGVAACATALPQIVARDDDMFDVRYDADVHTQAAVDAKANAHCMDRPAVFVSQATRFDGLAYRTYLCARS